MENWLFFGAVLAALLSFCLAINQLRYGLAMVLVVLFLFVVPITLAVVASFAAEFGRVF